MKNNLWFFILSLAFTASLHAQFSIDVESGAIFSGYNDVRIPGDKGTLFSFSEELKVDPSTFVRLRLCYDFNRYHHFSVLVAPLTLRANGQLNREIQFFGEIFPADTPLKGTYRFNSYRVTYCYDFFHDEKLEGGVGFTAKIRDAEISLASAESYASKKNVGFVPIVNFKILWHMRPTFGLLFEGDALAAPQGRAEDVQVALRYRPSNRLAARLGYRILEGGADNDEVYTFSLFHYAAFGITWHF